MIPGGQLLFAANNLNAFQTNPRIQKFFSQWTANAIRARGFSQSGNGCYPVYGDNWTCGKLTEEFIQFYCFKVAKTLFESNEPIATARRIRDVFSKIVAQLESLDDS